MNEKDSLEFRINGDGKGLTQALDNVEKKGEKTLTTLKQGAQKTSFSFDEIKNKALKIGALFGLSAGVIKKGFDSIIKIAQFFIGNWSKALREAAEISRKNAESIREVAEANDTLREKTDGLMKRLKELSVTEKLSNVQKLEQTRLLQKLKAGYSDLVDSLTDAEGKLKDVDQAFAAKLKRDQERRMTVRDG